MELHNEPFDIRQLIQQTADLFEEKARRKGVDLVYLVHHDVPADRARRSGPLPPGADQPAGQRGQVHRGRRDHGARGHRRAAVRTASLLRLEVSGHRHRRQPEAQAQLFQPFVQADGSITRALRRHRPGPGDLAAAGRADGRRLDMTSEVGSRLDVLVHRFAAEVGRAAGRAASRGRHAARLARARRERRRKRPPPAARAARELAA